jgi:hypothetical protein
MVGTHGTSQTGAQKPFIKLDKLEPVYQEVFTARCIKELEHGKIYISLKYQTSAHRCACGCGEEVILPFNYETFPHLHWQFTQDGTFSPSIGNQNYNCRSHYFIRGWNIDWLPDFPR